MLSLDRVRNPRAETREKRAVILAAHSDDQAIGCGGTLLVLKEKGFETIVIILSRGELSHPWLREEVITQKRRAESIRAMRILRVDETIFFPLTEKELLAAEEDPRVLETLRTLLQEASPSLVFTHNDEDSHAIHRVVHRLTLEAMEDIPGRILAYDIWTLAHKRRLREAWVYVDITRHVKEKWRAIRVFSSQRMAIATQYIPIHTRHIVNGILSGFGFAERFAVIRDA